MIRKRVKFFWRTSHGNLRKSSRINEEGIFKFHTLSYIHSLDDNVEKIFRELNILQRFGVLSKNNEISKAELDKIEEYRTYWSIAYKKIEKERGL